MYIFLDESGDLGFNFNNKKTSKYFVITVLVCQNRSALSIATKAAKKTLKNKLNKKSSRIKQELKGSETTIDIKSYFYKLINKEVGVSINAVIVNKEKICQKIASIDKVRLYKKMCFVALENCGLRADTTSVHLMVDKCMHGAEAKAFSVSLCDVISNAINLSAKVLVEQKSSCEEYGLQSVDMFSYGIFSKYEFGVSEWYDIFSARISDERSIE